MISHSLGFALLVSLVQAIPNLGSVAGVWPRQDQITIQADSPLDHRWITNIAALGESYVAGQGAGHEIKGSDQIERNSDCNQFSWSFPILLNARGMLGDNSARKIQHLACSGAKTADVLDKQIPKLKPSQLIVLSIGGNDAHLVDILNYCVYQWSVTLTWSCDKELAKALADIQSQDFFDSLNKVMDQSKAKLIDKNSRIIWLGYERFFSVETTECDQVTWGFSYKWGFREFLTQARRKQMNDLVDQVNHITKGVCEQHPECIFVDSNPQIDQFNGHFCEAGVDERYSKGNGQNRELTWFYEWDTTKDNDSDEEKKVDQPQKRQDEPVQAVSWDNSTFEGSIVSYITQGLTSGELDPSINFLLPTAKDTLSTTSSSWYRVFHRTKAANGMIAVNVLRAIQKYQAELMQEPVPVITLPGGCHSGPKMGEVVTADPASAATATATATAETAPPTASSPPPPPYSPTGNVGENKQDRCQAHVVQKWDCMDVFTAAVQLLDAGGAEMAALSDDRPLAGDGSSWKSKLESELRLSGSKDNIQFKLGGISWSTDDKDQAKDNWCDVQGYNPSEPQGLDVCQDAVKNIDCYFKCPYNGGQSSDSKR